MGRPDYILGQFREIAQCRDANFLPAFVNITSNRLFWQSCAAI